MTNKDLKKRIEVVIDNEITKGGAFGFQKDMDRVVNKLTKLAKEYCDWVIGEDEPCSKFDKSIKDENYLRNQLRAEQRGRNE